jgi:hypothetical protein
MTKACKGQLLYTHDGHMAALLQWPDVEPYEHGWSRGLHMELAATARKTMMYSGPYYLDEQPGNMQRIFHHPIVSVPPNWIDTLQPRLAEIIEESGRTFLTLGPVEPVDDNGTPRLLQLRWVKMEPNNATEPPAGVFSMAL